MKVFMRPFGLLSILLACMTGCQNKPEEKKTTLRLSCQNDPVSLDPRIAGHRYCQVFLRDLFEGLTRLDMRGDPQMAGAESVEISPDGRLYRFHLRKNFWSNGQPVLASDYEYAFKTLLAPSFPSNANVAFSAIKGAREAKTGASSINEIGIRALNDKTLEIELVHPLPSFLEALANPIFSPVPKNVVEKNPNWASNGGKYYVSNGPYTLASWTHSSNFILVKNPFYHDAKRVKCERIHVTIVPDPEASLALFQKGEIDIVGDPFGSIPLEAIPPLIKSGRLKLLDNNSLYWLEVNTQDAMLSSPKIRKALALACNRKELIENLLRGEEKVALSILPPLLTLLEKPLFCDNDIASAQLLFAEGLRDLGLKSSSLPPLIISCWSDPREIAIAEALSGQWQKALGITCEIASCDFKTHMKKIFSGNYQIASFTWISWYADPMYNLESMKYRSCGLNGTGWEHEDFIKALDRADITIDKKKRKEALRLAETLIVEEMPLIPIYYPTYKYMQNPRLKGIYITPLGQLELKFAFLEGEKK
jgi:oligopeptide transport system substrate-binding protein